MTLTAAAEREIVALHRFFDAWFTGRVPGDEATLARFSGVLADDFEIVSPGGNRLGRGAILDFVRAAHGRHAPGRFRLWIERVAARPLDAGHVLATYEEWQEQDGERRGRLSSAVLARRDGPHGLVWRHLHETWLPGSAPASA